MIKLQNTLDNLNQLKDLLFFDWELEICRDYSETEESSALLVSATFFYDGEEIKVSEWVDFLNNTHLDGYYSNGGAEELALAMDISSAVAYLVYRAFVSEFNIAYNLSERE